MKQIKQQLAYKPFKWMIAMTIVFFFGNATGYLASEPNSPPPPSAEQTEPANIKVDAVCQVDFQIFTDKKMEEYREWMENHFQNKSSTSSLLTDGIGRYEELRKTLMDEFYTYVPKQNALLLTAGLEGPVCKRVADTALAQAKKLLESKARTTSAVKRSTILLNKYQDMNDKLAKLAKDFLQMKAYLNTFAAKLPCYIKRSCNKG